MLNLFLRPLRILAQLLAGNDSPRQTAWGVSLGMMVGLLPKGNLTAVALAMLVCALAVNRAAALLAIAACSYLGGALDGFAHRVGSMVLTWPAAHDAWQWFYDQPMGPWLGLNNTIVLGQLLIGLYLLWPTYQFGRLVATRVQPRIHGWLMRRRVIRWLRGAELGTQWGFEG